MTRRPEETRYLSLPAGIRLRVGATIAAALGVVLVMVAALIRSKIELRHVVAEEGVLELVHPWNWTACTILAAFGCFRPNARRDTCFFYWVSFLCMLAGLRELDYHVVLNPENIHLIGLSPEHALHFRIDWWSDHDTPLAVRLGWAAVIVIGLAAFFIPLILARVRWKRLALGLDAFAWTFAAACGFVGLGWFFDDIILRLYTKAPHWGQTAEEVAETIGQVLMFVALVLAVRASPHRRAIGLLHRSPKLGLTAGA